VSVARTWKSQRKALAPRADGAVGWRARRSQLHPDPSIRIHDPAWTRRTRCQRFPASNVEGWSFGSPTRPAGSRGVPRVGGAVITSDSDRTPWWRRDRLVGTGDIRVGRREYVAASAIGQAARRDLSRTDRVRRAGTWSQRLLVAEQRSLHAPTQRLGQSFDVLPGLPPEIAPAVQAPIPHASASGSRLNTRAVSPGPGPESAVILASATRSPASRRSRRSSARIASSSARGMLTMSIASALMGREYAAGSHPRENRPAANPRQ